MGGIEPIVRSDQDMWLKEYDVDADTATAMFLHDPVKLETDGNVTVMAAASDDYLGPVMVIKDTNGAELSYLPASTAGKVIVATNPSMRFVMKAEGVVAKTAIGDCCDFDFVAGSITTGLSGMKLDTGTLAGDNSSAQVRILGKVDYPGADWGDSGLDLLCIAAEHALNDMPAAL